MVPAPRDGLTPIVHLEDRPMKSYRTPIQFRPKTVVVRPFVRIKEGKVELVKPHLRSRPERGPKW